MNVLINGVSYVPAPPAPRGLDLMDALEVRFNSDAGDNITVREYLRILLTTLWVKGEGFSSKRPFGNSGWHNEIISALVKAGFIDGQENGPDEWADADNDDEAREYVRDLILCAFHGEP